MPVVDAGVAITVVEVSRIDDGAELQPMAPRITDLPYQPVTISVPELNRKTVVVGKAVQHDLVDRRKAGIGLHGRKTAEPVRELARGGDVVVQGAVRDGLVVPVVAGI